MNDYLIDLKSAFENIDQRYFFAEVYRNLDSTNQNSETVIQSTENSFSAELFSNWRQIMKSQDKRALYDGLALDFDVRKDWFDEIIINKTLNSYRPDLVLHASQLIWDPPFQKVYIEVKTNPNPFVIDDIRKIINAQTRLHFEVCVFISVNSDIIKLKQLLLNIKHTESRRLNNYSINWSRIYLFHSSFFKSKRVDNILNFTEL